ncbi:MAG: hypothetical protein ABII68_04140 [Pseudomonadota bacterium]
MTRKRKKGFAGKHPADRKADPAIAGAVRESAENGKITCAEAFAVSGEQGAPPSEVGFTIDSLDLRIAECQLGLFGYRPRKKIVRPADSVSGEMEGAIRDAMVENRLSCISAWKIAERFGVGKMEISSACEALKIKIGACQLGAF